MQKNDRKTLIACYLGFVTQAIAANFAPLLFLFLLMICSGASGLAMAQWASAYAEAALGLSKTLGDLAGPCLFAVTMGISRSLYGKYGEKVELSGFMLASGALVITAAVHTQLLSWRRKRAERTA